MFSSIKIARKKKTYDLAHMYIDGKWRESKLK